MNVLWTLFVYPLHLLFVQVWHEGALQEDICSRETSVPSAFWTEHPEVCENVISRKVYRIAFLGGVILYYVMLVKLVFVLLISAKNAAMARLRR